MMCAQRPVLIWTYAANTARLGLTNSYKAIFAVQSTLAAPLQLNVACARRAFQGQLYGYVTPFALLGPFKGGTLASSYSL
jgi:hypothetical protein